MAAGVAFAHRPPSSDTGTLLYIGLAPEHRGRGLGRLLHAQALASLKAAGASSYEDATAASNLPMRRVFERNGCGPQEEFRLYSWTPAPAPPRFAGFDAFVAHIAERGFRHRFERPGRVTVRLRFAHAEADVAVEWSTDPPVIHVVRAYDVRVPPQAYDRVARAVCSLDGTLELPGFVFNQDDGTLAFRSVLPTDSDGGVATTTLIRVLRHALFTADRWEPAWSEMADAAEPVPKASLLRVRVAAP
jgi:hypothetical protein